MTGIRGIIKSILGMLYAHTNTITQLTRRLAILETEFKAMSKEQDDLAAAVATMTTAVTGAADEISALVAKVLGALHAPTGVDPAAAEAAAVAIDGLAAKLNEAVAAANTAVAPPAAAPAVETPAA